MPRPDGRRDDELRPLALTRGYTDAAPGSVLVEAGRTRILCTASVDRRVPDWMRGKGTGWVTAEYAMLPGSTNPRKRRDSSSARRDSRGVEISRLIGRALRAVVDLDALGARTLWLDCDVLQADGGTRTLAISGAWVALRDAIEACKSAGEFDGDPLRSQVAAVSVGIVDGRAVLDLPYDEDSRAAVDMNVVMTGEGRFVEVQGSAEGEPFTREQHDTMMELATTGISQILAAQREAIGA